MALTGKVYHRLEAELLDVTVVDDSNFTLVTCHLGGVEVIKFPLALGQDPDWIASKIANIINQSGLVDPPVRVELS